MTNEPVRFGDRGLLRPARPLTPRWRRALVLLALAAGLWVMAARAVAGALTDYCRGCEVDLAPGLWVGAAVVATAWSAAVGAVAMLEPRPVAEVPGD